MEATKPIENKCVKPQTKNELLSKAQELLDLKNYTEALPILKSLAKHHNNRDAQYVLGEMYEKGLGVLKDY